MANPERITRRVFLRNTVAASAAIPLTASAVDGVAATPAVASPAPEVADGPLGLPRATWDAYAGRTAALERLQHHLLAAALTLDEICPANNARWLVVMGGKAGAWRPWFRVERYDLVREPMSDAAQAGIDVERMTVVHELRARAAS